MPKVFISYSQDSEAHSKRVLALAQALRIDGITTELDQFHAHKVLHWPDWCCQQLQDADYVICICTAEYRNRADGNVPADVGKGAHWEVRLICNEFYDQKGNGRVVLILFDAEPESSVPRFMVNWTNCRIKEFELADFGYKRLCHILTGRPLVEPAVVGGGELPKKSGNLNGDGQFELSKPSDVQKPSKSMLLKWCFKYIKLWEISLVFRQASVFFVILALLFGVAYAVFLTASGYQFFQVNHGNLPVNASGYTPLSQEELLSNQKLSEFRIAYDSFDGIADDGPRCEQIFIAFTRLSVFDVGRGKAMRVQSSAIENALRCQRELQESDIRINAMISAFDNASKGQGFGDYEVAVKSFNLLNAFDKSRARFASVASLIDKANSYESQLIASKARIDVVISKYNKFIVDPKPINQLELANSYEKLSDKDRMRLHDDQPRVFSVAEKAKEAVHGSYIHFQFLQNQLRVVEGNFAEKNIKDLILKFKQIGESDLALASSDQLDIYVKSKHKIDQFGWRYFDDKIMAYMHSHTPQMAESVVEIYNLMKIFKPEELSDQQREMLSSGKEIADSIARSDARIRKMLDLVDEWRKHKTLTGIDFSSNDVGITEFDKLRFDVNTKNAWIELHKAVVIYNARIKGLSGSTKSEIPIFVQSNSYGPDADIIVNALKFRLNRIGLFITDDLTDAAIKVLIDVKEVAAIERDFSGRFIGFSATVTLMLSVTWQFDGSSLLSGDFMAGGHGDQESDAKKNSMKNAFDKIEDRFQEMIR